jgi:uncharacterized membrane protein SirB2
MEESRMTENAAPAEPRLWRRIINKPAREIGSDVLLFVLGVVVLYVLDLTVISRAAPIAVQSLLDLVLYVNHHAVAAVQMLY